MTAYRDRLNAGHYLPAPPIEEATVEDLKAQLKDAGLPVSGTKDELKQRLENAEATDTE